MKLNGKIIIRTFPRILMALWVFFCTQNLFAVPVDFYKTVSSASDTNMIKMTEDLFFSQMQTLEGYTVNDRRNTAYVEGTTSSSNIIFYAEIQSDSDGMWICTLNAISGSSGKMVNAVKKYASYYKILLDAKPSLENLLNSLTGNIGTISGETSDSSSSPVKDTTLIENIAGTWGGENFIEKIVILRAGKGFVIFKNGASMNISVEGNGNNVTITQTSRGNASFYPEISREKAIKLAGTLEPVTWNLTLENNSTLKGTKSTVKEDLNSQEGIKPVKLNVTWTKK